MTRIILSKSLEALIGAISTYVQDQAVRCWREVFVERFDETAEEIECIIESRFGKTKYLSILDYLTEKVIYNDRIDPYDWELDKYGHRWVALHYYEIYMILESFQNAYKILKLKDDSYTPEKMFSRLLYALIKNARWEGSFDLGMAHKKRRLRASSKGGSHSKIRAPIIKAWVENYFKTDPKHTCAGALSRFRTFKKAAPNNFNGYKLFHSATDERELFCQTSPDGKEQCISEKRFRDYCPPKRPRKKPIK